VVVEEELKPKICGRNNLRVAGDTGYLTLLSVGRMFRVGGAEGTKVTTVKPKRCRLAPTTLFRTRIKRACATPHSLGKVDQIHVDAVTGLMQFRMGDDGHIFEGFALVNSSCLKFNEDRSSTWSGRQREQLDNRWAQPLM